MFSPEDRQYITDLIYEKLSRQDNPRQLINVPFKDTNFADGLTDGDSRKTLALDAVRICIEDAWAHEPAWMWRLLDLFGLIRSNGKIASIWASAQGTKPFAVVEELNATILYSAIPFVNRSSLRVQLNSLHSLDGEFRPILVVNGDEKAGKSYSANYIDYYCNKKTTLVSCIMQIEPGFALEMGAIEIAKGLVQMLDGDMDSMPQPSTNSKRYAGELASWVLTTALSQKGYTQVWFVMDNFSMQELRIDARDLLIALADLVTKGLYKKKCRIIITGFDRALLTVDPGRIDEEIVSICTPDDIDITISEIFTVTSTSVPASAIDLIKRYVKTGLPAGKEKMTVINDRLRAVLYTVPRFHKIFQSLPKGLDYGVVLLNVLSDIPPGSAATATLDQKLKVLANVRSLSDGTTK